MILRKNLFPLRFAENDPPDPPAGEVRGACPVCQSEIVCAGGVVRGGEPSEHYTELQRKADASEVFRNRVSELERAHPAPAPTPTPAPGPAPAPTPARRKTFL